MEGTTTVSIEGARSRQAQRASRADNAGHEKLGFNTGFPRGLRQACRLLASFAALFVVGADNSETWTESPNRWHGWFFESYAASARYNQRWRMLAAEGEEPFRNTPNMQCDNFSTGRSAKRWVQGVSALEELPIALVNLRADRRNASLSLLHQIGLTNIAIPPLSVAEDLDISYLEERGRLQGKMQRRIWEGDASARVYLARAVDQLYLLADFLEQGHDMFAIFEDDLWLAPDAMAEKLAEEAGGGWRQTMETERALSAAGALSKIRTALDVLPATADMLYLEVCGEKCEELRYSPGGQLVRAEMPFCSAAIIHTRRGAINQLESMATIFDGLDLMYAQLVGEGKLEAYIAVPPIFYQDTSSGTDALREQGTKAQRFAGAARPAGEKRGAYLMACSDIEACHFRIMADLHGAGVVKRLQANEYPLVRAALSTLGWRLRPLLIGWAALHGNESAVVVRSRRARAGNEHVIENGRFRLSEGSADLKFDPTSACYLAVLLRTPPVAGTASRALPVWRHAQAVGESWMQGGEGWRWSADGRPELSSMDPASDDSLMETNMGDAVADEQTTRWCNLELEVVSPLIPDGSERVKATVSVTFVSEAL